MYINFSKINWCSFGITPKKSPTLQPLNIVKSFFQRQKKHKCIHYSFIFMLPFYFTAYCTLKAFQIHKKHFPFLSPKKGTKTILLFPPVRLATHSTQVSYFIIFINGTFTTTITTCTTIFLRFDIPLPSYWNKLMTDKPFFYWGSHKKVAYRMTSVFTMFNRKYATALFFGQR